MIIFKDVVGNTSPSRTITLERNGTAINLSGSTVDLIITNENTGSQTNSGHTSCSITTAASGIVSYTPVSGDFPSAGRYLAEVKITYGSGAVERLYEVVLFVVRAATT